MAIAIQEYLGFKEHSMQWSESVTGINASESLTIDDPICSESIMVDIEGIHVGPTRNYTWYTEQALRSSIQTWTQPYLRPVIMHHNESDGKIIGRTKHVEYTDVNTKSGTGALLFTVNIPDKEGKEQIRDGRLKTVSIGVIVHDATCSICGCNIAQSEECEHERGNVYDGKVCYWMINKMEAKELSYVIVPSDIYAQNIRIYDPKINKSLKEGVLNLSEKKEDLQQKEGSIIDETVKGTSVADTNTQTESELEVLKKENSDLKKQIEDYIELNKKTEASLEKISKEVEKLKLDLESKEEEVILSKSKAIKEAQLRKSAEDEILKHKNMIKENLVKEVISLRESLGKESNEEDFALRSAESLQDSIKDLKEEMKIDVNNISVPDNPGLSMEENKEENVDKEKSNSNINLAESLESLFSGIVSSHTK